MPNGIAWDFIPNIAKAQLIHCRPDLFAHSVCKRCGGSVLISYGERECLNCGADHDSSGNLIPTRDPIAEGIKLNSYEKSHTYRGR